MKSVALITAALAMADTRLLASLDGTIDRAVRKNITRRKVYIQKMETSSSEEIKAWNEAVEAKRRMKKEQRWIKNS